MTENERFAAGKYDGVIQIMDATGDSRYMWDIDNPTEVARAAEVFKSVVAKGSLCYVTPEKSGVDTGGEKISAFSETAPRIVVIPQFAGG